MARIVHIFRQPQRFIAGTVGQPGDRIFYLQASDEGRLVSVVLEKAQVAVLAERIGSLLVEVRRRFGTDIPNQEATSDVDPLTVPIDEEFRVGTMGLGWDMESGNVVIELLAVTDTEIDESMVLADRDEGPDALRVFLSPERAQDFALRAELVVRAGRKPCPLCHEPLDPDGHICPRLNGYRQREIPPE